MAGAFPRLDVQDLSKTFGSARVLDKVRLTIFPGEIHGLAGHNGSGKSTFIRILAGALAPDPGGRCRVDGAPLRLPARWPETHAAGLSVVHQDLGLFEQASVADNVCMGAFPTHRWTRRIDGPLRDRLTKLTLQRLGVDINPATPVTALVAGRRAEVALARAVRDHTPGTGLLVLDEATRAMTGGELIAVHALLRRIAAQGGAVLLVSHSLPELLGVTDRITILRDGRTAAEGLPVANLTEDRLADIMLGSTGTRVRRPPSGVLAKVSSADLVQITGLRGGALDSLDLNVAKGEILGITGLPGSGYQDIPMLLSGAQRAAAGEVRIGRSVIDLRSASVPARIRAGIVLVPERRERDGLAFDLSVRDNICLPLLRSHGRPWFVGHSWQTREVEAWVRRLDIRPSAPGALKISQLSGGNQQKALLAKWLAAAPALLVLHEPTQGVDVNARQVILKALCAAAESGVAVLLVSSETEDLAAICDRVLARGQDGTFTPVAPLTAGAISEALCTHGSG